ncbi:MAG: gliding motility-associated-like protein, partial [Parvicella sp.]
YSSVASVDIDWTGSQAPRTGSNYVGVFTYSSISYREYVQVELLAHMVPGDQYLAEMYVSKAERMANATNNIGMYFSDSPATQFSYSTMGLVSPQIKSTAIITDEINWVRIVDTLIVDSDKKFLTLGNFDYNVNTSVIYQATDPQYDNNGYYYIDDVSVRRITNNYTPVDTTICESDSAKLYALFDGFSHWEYDSLPGNIISTDSVIWVQPNSTTSYSAVGSMDTSHTTVHVIHNPFFDLGPDTTICVNNTVVFNAGSNNYSIVWSDGSDNGIYSTSSPGYVWIALINTCATYQDSVLVSLLPEPYISIGPDTTICLGDTIALQADDVYDNYYWDDDDTLATLSVYSEGVYTLVVAYECGFISDYKWVYMDSLPPLQLANDTTVCLGEEIFINNFTNSYLGYSWQDGSTDSTYLADTSGMYWLDVTHRCGIDSDSITIFYFDMVDLSLGADTTLCIGDTLLLQVPSHTGNTLWNDNSTNSSLVVNTSGWYWAEVTENGCSYSDSIVIDTLSLPSLQIESDSAYCEGDSLLIVVNVQGEDQLIWSTGDTIDSVFVNSPGLYFVAATNICGASYDNINVVEKPLPDFSLGADTSFCLGDFIFITAPDSAGTIIWDNGSTYYSRQIKEDGNYWATATVQGCSYTDTIYVDTTLCEILLELPNVFTPNDDGENDVFKAIRLGGIDELNIQIYNRWGQLLYVSNSKHFAWDGRNFANEKVPSSSYFYIIEYTDVLGVEKKVSGNIGLFR